MTQPTWPDLWFDLPLAVIDVETTGFNPDEDRIIEVAVIHFHRGQVTEEWGQLVNPGRPIPSAVQTLTGITDADVAAAPPFSAIAAEVAQRLQRRGLVAYNLSFDRGFIRAELTRCGLSWPDDAPIFDPLIFARQFLRDGSKKLGKVAERLGINLVEAHRAIDDATTAGLVLYAFQDRLPARLQDLQVLQAQWERQQAQDTSNWRRPRRSDDAWGIDNADAAQTIGLGPAYLYGDDPDPLRALYRSIPEARS
jgi:DNA polymerase III epsilon subunit family exonuclease